MSTEEAAVNIYHIERNAACGYDEVSEVVVVAETELEARDLFASQTAPDKGPGDEGLHVWLNRHLTRAVRLGSALDPTPRVVVRHFVRG